MTKNLRVCFDSASALLYHALRSLKCKYYKNKPRNELRSDYVLYFAPFNILSYAHQFGSFQRPTTKCRPN